MKNIHLLSGIAFGLILVGLVTLNHILVAMAIPFVLYLFSGLITVPNQVDITISRTLSSQRTTPGNSVEIRVTVANQGKRLESVLIRDILHPSLLCKNGSPYHLFSLAVGEERTWQYTVEGKRGFYRFDTCQLEYRDRLGNVCKRKTIPTTGQLLIMPPVLKLKGVRIRPRSTRVYSGIIPARSGGSGVDFFGVRDYHEGDPPAWINWRASARHPGHLLSNEFEQERVADVGIVLDGREWSNRIATKTSIFEYSVMAAATLASAFLAQGDRVSLLHYGKYLQWTFPGYGKIQKERILRVLTEVEPGKSLVFAYLQYLPTQIFPAQSQIVLVSPLTEDDPDVLLEIRARGYRVLVISPNPVTFELAQLPDTDENQMSYRILTLERKLMLRQLEKGGIRVIDWDVRRPFDQEVGRLNQRPALDRSVGMN